MQVLNDARLGVAQSAGRVWAAALAALALAAASAGLVWRLAFSVPTADPLPLPDHLVSATTPEGQRLLAESAALADHPPLTAALESQRRPALCGVASSVAVLNALRPSGPRLTQTRFFSAWTTELQVTFNGMALQELAALLRQHGAHAVPVFAQDTSLEAFRAGVGSTAPVAPHLHWTCGRRLVSGWRCGAMNDDFGRGGEVVTAQVGRPIPAVLRSRVIGGATVLVA